MLQTALHFSHTLLQEILQPGDHVVDATMGNGHDTVFLAEHIGKTGHVYSFDIQQQAIDATRERLEQRQLEERVSLFLQGHETLGEVIAEQQNLKAGIFNLGYLPKSDKAIITMPETTRTAMEEILKRLVPRGRLILVVYYGHEGGEKELDMVGKKLSNERFVANAKPEVVQKERDKQADYQAKYYATVARIDEMKKLVK